MTLGEIAAIVAAVIAVLALERARRADYRLALYNERLVAAREISLALTEFEQWVTRAAEMDDEAAMEQLNAMRRRIDPWIPVLDPKVILAIGAYTKALGDLVQGGWDDRQANLERAKALRIVREMLKTGTLHNELESLFQNQRSGFLRRGGNRASVGSPVSRPLGQEPPAPMTAWDREELIEAVFQETLLDEEGRGATSGPEEDYVPPTPDEILAGAKRTAREAATAKDLAWAVRSAEAAAHAQAAEYRQVASEAEGQDAPGN